MGQSCKGDGVIYMRAVQERHGRACENLEWKKE